MGLNWSKVRAIVRWWHAIVLLALLGLAVGLGNWQRGRADYKKQLRAQYEAQQQLPAQLLDSTLQAELERLPERYRYQLVEARGRFLLDQYFWIDNRMYKGQAGYQLVVPLLLMLSGEITGEGATGKQAVILVNRGWLPQGADRRRLPEPVMIDEPIIIRGRLNLPVRGYLELAKQTVDGRLWQNLDPARFAAATQLAVLPLVIEELAEDGVANPTGLPVPLVRDWTPPDWGIEKHQSYMIQWYALGVLALLWYVIVAWRASQGVQPIKSLRKGKC